MEPNVLGQNWDLRQRAGVYADHVGHRPCEVGPFPHGQQQFLPQHLGQSHGESRKVASLCVPFGFLLVFFLVVLSTSL